MLVPDRTQVMTKTVVFDNIYNIRQKLGKGGMSTVFLAEVDLSKFDYSTLFAYTQVQADTHTKRRKEAEKLARSLRGKHLDPATMHTILRAQNIPVPGREVALKVATHNVNHKRFAGEWQNLLCLSHPNVIEVYGGGEYRQQPYYVMQFLNTMVPLPRMLKEFTLREKLNVLMEAGRGLQYLHDHGIIHRDIKPGNIATCKIAQGKYTTRIMDLGLAKNIEENLGLTHTNTIIGSPAYMSPEQVASARDVDHRADIYSLGATMYQLLTGKRPYHDRSGPYEVIIAISTKVPPVSPRTLVPELPSPLLGIIQTAMEFDAADRYTCVEDMVTDIQTYLEKESPQCTGLRNLKNVAGSAVKLGQGDFIFEQMLKKRHPEAVAGHAPPALPTELDSYKLLVMNRKHAQHTVFSRSARELTMEYRSALTPRKAAELMDTEKIDVAAFEYTRNLPQVADLCRKARSAGIPFLLYGENLSRADILNAARLGASAVMISPISESLFREKILHLLAGSSRPAAEPKKGVTTLHFSDGAAPPAKARQVARRAKSLLALPHAASKVISLCNDPNASADDLATPISSDSAIAAMVLRRANSVALGGSRKIGTIRDAVVRIGRRETRQLAITMAIYKLFDKREKSFGFNRYMYWIHALGAGIAARNLAEKIPRINPEQAFLAGLLHDIGKIIFDDHLNREYQELIKRASTEGLRICKAEQEMFVMDHAFMGARISEQWNLPQEITEAIETHHRAAKAGDESQKPRITLGRLASMGNSLIKAMGAGHSGDFYVDDIPGAEWQLALRQLDAIPNYCEMVRRELVDFADMLGIDTVESGLTGKSLKRKSQIAIVPDGLGILLHFFFSARGYGTSFIAWEEMENCDCDIACDARDMPDNILRLFDQPDTFWGRHVFLLCDDDFRTSTAGAHRIVPANDFFRLEQKVADISREDKKQS